MTLHSDRSRRFRPLVLPFTAQARARTRQGRDGRVSRRCALALESLEERTVLTPTINFANGFAGASGLTLNGGATISGPQLQLTDGNQAEARSVFYNTPVNVSQFTTTFDFQIAAGTHTADGFTFTIQNNSPTAVGANGSELGYGPTSTSGTGILNSLAVKFDLYNSDGEGNDSTGVYTDGAAPTVPADDLTSSGVNLHSGDLISATIAYDGPSQALSLSIADLATGGKFTKTYAENLAAAVGSSTAYVGFTAGTGGGTATQSIQSWFFTTLPTVTNESAAPVAGTEATLNASVNPNSTGTTVQFQYSTDPTFAPTVQTVIGFGFNRPGGVAVDGAGDVFVADTFDSDVEEYSPGGTLVGTIGIGFFLPYGVAVDGAGDVFVADTLDNAVKEVLPDGTVKTVGSGFNEPQGVAEDGAGDVFVADTRNNSVKEVLPDGTVKTIGSGFSEPNGVAVDGAGDVFVADTLNNAVEEVLPNGAIQTIGYGFSEPAGVAVDGAGDVFVADTGQSAVQEVLPNGTVQTIGSGFNAPEGVAVEQRRGRRVRPPTFSRRCLQRVLPTHGCRLPLTADRHVGKLSRPRCSA